MCATAEPDFYLPDECWQSTFQFLIDDGCDYEQRLDYLKSLSVVSKQFLTITNSLLFSLKLKELYNSEFPLLPCLLNRFSNLNSLDLQYYQQVNLNELLCQISTFPLKNLKSLHFYCYLSDFPADGLRVFSKNITTLTSLTCSHIQHLSSTYLFLIADCFPLLEELNLTSPKYFDFINNQSLLDGVEALSSTLFKLRKVNLSGHYYINNQSLLHLFKNCKLLEEAIILGCDLITSAGLAFALRERPTLKSLSFTCLFEPGCATLFAVSPQLKSLRIDCDSWLSDEGIKLFASIFPKLEVLDLSDTGVDDETLCVISKSCPGLLQLYLENCYVTEKGVKHVVENCTQLREISLMACKRSVC
ncbi:F-box/LRR-repeat protein [Trifolium pratense]|uniref:F-box/LRR-repeat protein n=1 Tax=Trifolium pratense TaxID=57577 RepID=A0A2K3P823_TRIPR|nr:F-box/LRR-repeat protein [Trifolium pratense]PNY11442.1 F-box/LRR-repeat protein [Trifolium pratense]